MVAAVLAATIPAIFAQDGWRQQVEAQRKRRDAYLGSDPFTPLALVHREYLEGRKKLTIGRGADAELRLAGEGVAPLHATVEVTAEGTLVTAELGARMYLVGQATSSKDGASHAIQNPMTTLDLAKNSRFRIGQYNLLYRADAPVRGAAIEVYDTASPGLREYRGLEFFPIDARYRVQAEIMPRAEPPQVQLVDSAGQPRPYSIYGDLRFTLDGQAVTMEVYSTTLDAAAIARSGFMLIFADATSGKESYYAARYLDIEGKLSGAVTVDFNLARNPPCAFSPAFTCPFPRAQNRLPVAIRAGEKAYKDKTAAPLRP